jgi:hypothetical protein
MSEPDAVSFEPEAELPTEAQARVEARAAHQVFMTVLVSKEATGRPFPGLPLANALFNAGDRSLNETFDVALGVLAGFRLGALSTPAASTVGFVDAVSAYFTAFKAEFRRIDSGLRAGGQERDEMTAYVNAELDEAQLLVWREAFAMAELPSGWERQVRAAAERDEQARRSAQPSDGRSWLPSAFRRRSG